MTTCSEMVEILADADTMAAIREGVADLRSGRTHSQEDVARAMHEAGRG